jgi:hypothetical protein
LFTRCAEGVDPHTAKPFLSSSTKQAYKKNLVAYLKNEYRIGLADKRQILYFCISSKQLTASDVPLDFYSLLKPMFSIKNASLPWIEFTLAYEQAYQKSTHPAEPKKADRKGVEQGETADVQKNFLLLGAAQTEDAFIQQASFQEDVKLEEAEQQPEVEVKKVAVEAAQEKIFSERVKTRSLQRKKNKSKTKSKPVHQPKLTKTEERQAPVPVQKVEKEAPRERSWLDDFKDRLEKGSLSDCRSMFMSKLSQKNSARMCINAFALLFDKFVNNDAAMTQSLLALLTKPEVMALHEQHVSECVGYYFRLSANFSVIQDNKLKMQGALGLCSALARLQDIGAKEAQLLLEYLQSVAGAKNLPSGASLNELSTNLGNVLDKIISLDGGFLLEFLKYAYLFNASPIVSPKTAALLADSAACSQAGNAQDLMQQWNIFQMMLAKLPLEEQVEQNHKVASFVERFISFSAWTNATTCACQLIEPHSAVMQLAEVLKTGKQWKDVEALILHSKGLSEVQAGEYVLTLIELWYQHEAPLNLIITGIDKTKEKLKEISSKDRMTKIIFDLVSGISAAPIQNKKKLSFELLTFFKVPVCDLWEPVLRDYSANGCLPQVEAAWAAFKQVYSASAFSLPLGSVLLGRLLKAGGKDPHLYYRLDDELHPTHEQKTYSDLLYKNALASISDYQDQKLREFIEFLKRTKSSLEIAPSKEVFQAIAQASIRSDDETDFQFAFDLFANEKYRPVLENQEVWDLLTAFLLKGFKNVLERKSVALAELALHFYCAHFKICWSLKNNRVELYQQALKVLPVLVASQTKQNWLPNTFIIPTEKIPDANVKWINAFKRYYAQLVEKVLKAKYSKSHPILAQKTSLMLNFLKELAMLDVERAFAADVLDVLGAHFEGCVKLCETLSEKLIIANALEKLMFMPVYSQDGNLSTLNDLEIKHNNLIIRTHDEMLIWLTKPSSVSLTQFITVTVPAYNNGMFYLLDCYGISAQQASSLMIKLLNNFMANPTRANIGRGCRLFSQQIKMLSTTDAYIDVMKRMERFCLQHELLKDHWGIIQAKVINLALANYSKK